VGVNLIYNGDEKFHVEGAAEAIERFEKGEIDQNELYRLILEAPVAPLPDQK
jgi:hypothetical protein